jgi:hypothetical protein
LRPNQSTRAASPVDINRIPDNYDPCSVDVGSVSNAQLLLYWTTADAYLRRTGRGQDRYFDYANLMRRLTVERRRRIHMGHAWLGVTGLTEVPYEMYEIIPGTGLTASIVPADSSSERGAPRERTSAVVTPRQFSEFLQRNNIPQLDVRDWYRRQARENPEILRLVLPPPPAPRTPWFSLDDPFSMPYGGMFYTDPFSRLLTGGSMGIGASGLAASPFDLSSRSGFLNPIYTPNTVMTNPRSVAGAELDWRGNIPERSLQSGSYADIVRYRDFNRLQANAPVFDVGTRFGDPRLISITHSLPGAGGQVDMSHYAEKVRIMSGDYDPRGTNLMGQAVTLLNQAYETSWTVTDINRRNYLAVPDDHVTMAQDALESRIARQPSAYANLVDGLLHESPITVGGTTYNSWNQVQSARSAGTINNANYNSLRQQLGQAARPRIVGVGMTLPEIVTLQQIRAGLQLRGFSTGQSSIIATAEILQTRRLMATGVPESQAINMVARGSALRGGGMGAAVGVGTGIYRIATGDANDPNTWYRAGVDIPLAALGGGGQAYLETQIATRLMSPVLTEATTMGAASSTSSLTASGLSSRVAGGLGAGAVVAPAVTWLGMGVEELFFDADYYWGDYAAKGARTGVAGAAAAGGGALASGVVGAVAGSEVPILGNAIGFLVGIGIYYLVDSSVGEDIEEGVREAAGERGCGE